MTAYSFEKTLDALVSGPFGSLWTERLLRDYRDFLLRSDVTLCTLRGFLLIVWWPFFRHSPKIQVQMWTFILFLQMLHIRKWLINNRGIMFPFQTPHYFQIIYFCYVSSLTPILLNAL